MEDREIEQRINAMLLSTSYVLVSFERSHGCFGNMIAVIKNLKNRNKHRFTSDRGDIYRDHDLIYASGYHIDGEDDAAAYFLKAIELATSMRSMKSTIPFHSTKGGKMKEDIITAHRYCSNHKEKLSADKKCGCFYCLKIFSPTEITEWLNKENGDPGGTALCPFCGIDSVIGESSGYPITETFMKEMYDYWFS